MWFGLLVNKDKGGDAMSPPFILRNFMRYTLKKGDEIFETDMWVMADRKYAAGWKFCAKEKALEEAAAELKKEFENKVNELYDKPIAGAKAKSNKVDNKSHKVVNKT